MEDVFDQAKRDQLRDHIRGLESAAASMESAAATRPPGVEREGMIGLSQRLRSSVDQLRAELLRLERLPTHPTVRSEAAVAD